MTNPDLSAPDWAVEVFRNARKYVRFDTLSQEEDYRRALAALAAEGERCSVAKEDCGPVSVLGKPERRVCWTHPGGNFASTTGSGEAVGFTCPSCGKVQSPCQQCEEAGKALHEHSCYWCGKPTAWDYTAVPAADPQGGKG